MAFEAAGKLVDLDGCVTQHRPVDWNGLLSEDRQLSHEPHLQDSSPVPNLFKPPPIAEWKTYCC